MKLDKLVFSLLFPFAFLLQISAIGQSDHIRFKRLTINDGLSLSSVYTIFQDSKGFMWFGTEDGLNKYDGKKFRIFRPDPANINSLSYKWTELVYEDSRGQLWFGAKGGLTRFDPETERFLRYGSHEGEHIISGDTITDLLEDKNNRLWVGTTSGINMINQNTGEVERTDLEELKIHTINLFSDDVWIGTNRGIFMKSGQNQSFQYVAIELEDTLNLDVYSIIQDTIGDIWVGLGNKLYKSSEQGKNIRWKSLVRPHDHWLEVNQIENLILEKHQSLWIGCSNGLYRYDFLNKQITAVIRAIDSSHSLAINPVKSLHLDELGYLWYGTYGEGIYRIDTRTGRYLNFHNNPGDLQSLSENAINCIYEDKSGDIWFGTFGAGINIYRPKAHKFGFMSHQPLNANSLSSNFIWSIMECDNELLWIGTNDAGLNVHDPVTNRFQIFEHNSGDQFSISHSSVRKVYQDSKKRIWIGTDGGGLNRFYPETGHFSHYKTVRDNPASISSNSVRVIYEDLEGRLWVGTRSGLNLFDPEKETFQRFIHDENDKYSISNDFVYSAIHHDKNGNLWIGTYGGGLNRMDIASGKFHHYANNSTDLESLSDNIVFSIHEDLNGILWIGTNGGLNQFDPSDGKFRRFGISEGLPNEVIYGILPDKSNNLWLSTNKGICRFSLDNFSTKNFSVNDGLQSNEFNGGAYHNGRSGRMYFGGVYGLNIVDPELGYIEDNPSQVVITSLEILGNEVNTTSDLNMTATENRIKKIGDQYYLPKNISYADEIILDYQNRFFSIEYAALNSTNTDNLRFQYIVEGLDNNWNDAGNRNFVTFANMQPGEYILKVRSENVDGFEGLSSALLKILITPPFWKTWWFYLFELLIAIVILSFIYKYLLKIKTNRLLRVQNEKIFDANQRLLDSENNLKQLNATKDKFFSIISHDLKNPFTSLLSISELMSDDYENLDEEDKEKGIKKVHDSAKRIYKLLENLLTWSRAQSGRVIYSPAYLDLDEIVNDCLLLHGEAAEKKGITLETNIPANVSAYCDREMTSTIVRNLLNNAIKFSPNGKTVKIEVEVFNAFWKLSIVDQGIGIAPENLEKVFQIETKFKTEGTSGEKGTGLGLIICKEFVEKNGGDISIISEEGKGSTFSITIPKTSSFVE